MFPLNWDSMIIVVIGNWANARTCSLLLLVACRRRHAVRAAAAAASSRLSTLTPPPGKGSPYTIWTRSANTLITNPCTETFDVFFCGVQKAYLQVVDLFVNNHCNCIISQSLQYTLLTSLLIICITSQSSLYTLLTYLLIITATVLLHCHHCTRHWHLC